MNRDKILNELGCDKNIAEMKRGRRGGKKRVTYMGDTETSTIANNYTRRRRVEEKILPGSEVMWEVALVLRNQLPLSL
jgi:hypothetical protein